VAPKPAPAGTPSPDALARLQAAVRKNPAAAGQRPAPVADRRDTAVDAERPRFGINSLINRMTGHPGEGAHPRPTAAQQPRAAAPQPLRDEEPDLSPEQERIEIPAFLRRQAN
jgi:cell division protein FtsZ